MSDGIVLIFGCGWLIAGLLEARTTIDHATRYNYKPDFFVAGYWLAIALGAFVYVFLIAQDGAV